MSEYIVCVDDLEKSYYSYTDIKPETVFGHRLREPIVRCGDCRYYDGEPDLDSSEPKCWRDPDHRGTPIWTRPDGFCAWGERREVER